MFPFSSSSAESATPCALSRSVASERVEVKHDFAFQTLGSSNELQRKLPQRANRESNLSTAEFACLFPSIREARTTR